MSKYNRYGFRRIRTAFKYKQMVIDADKPFWKNFSKEYYLNSPPFFKEGLGVVL